MRRTAAVMTALLACASCTASRVKPEANIVIAGTVQSASGAIDGAPLVLAEEGDPGDVLLVVTSLGIVCLDRTAPPAVCASARHASSDSAGRFSFRLKGRDTQSTFGGSSVLGLTTRVPARPNEESGAGTTYRFHVQTERLTLPVRVWEPSIDARTGSFGARVTFSRLPAGLVPFSQSAYRTSAVFVRGDEIVWELTDIRSGAAFDPRLLEDSAGAVNVVAEASSLRVSESLGDEVAIAMRSGARSYESPLDPPLSRGKPCLVSDERGHRYAVSPCRLTDGTYKEAFRPSVCSGETGCTEPRHAYAVVDLERSTPVDLIVLRGCNEPCRVETSTDGKSWRLAGIAQSDRASFAFSRPKSARFVRASGSINVDDITEISIWNGRPRVPDASLLVSPARFQTGGGSTSGGSGARREEGSDIGIWALVAVGALGLAAGGLVVAMIKRRKPAA